MATNTTTTHSSSSAVPPPTTTTTTSPPSSETPLETSPPSESKIWHKTLGSPSNPSLLLLHGIFGSHLEFTPLLPFLEPHYHIILVDLPGHSRSRSAELNSYRLPQTISCLASLILEQSPTQKCHVAGMSFGATVGLALARLYPDVVLSLFASGGPPFEGKEKFVVERPSLLYAIQVVTTYAPDFMFNFVARRASVTVPEGLRKEGQLNFNYQAMKDSFADMSDFRLDKIAEIRGVRTVAVAGGKQDNVDVTRRMGIALREGDPQSGCKAFVVRKAIHAWDMQFPELFAEGIKCWIEGEKMPEEFEELE